LAQSAAGAAQSQAAEGSLAARVDRSEFVTRALRQRINEAAARLEAGLTFLASVGSTAPFVGLFGTVWGIYHALMSIATAGTISIDKVAGPVGEALLMTAFGLAVAIPAVLAYNAFTRVNRLLLAQLDGFAHDLHAYVTTGARLESAA
jgi:biopolymer transport protein ExbB